MVERVSRFTTANVSDETVRAAEDLALRVLFQTSRELVILEALRGATDLVDFLHCVKDQDDEELFYLLRAIRNVVWTQRDLLKHALDRIEGSNA